MIIRMFHNMKQTQSFDVFFLSNKGKGKGSPYSITERRVPEPIRVLGSQPAGES